MLQVEAEAVVAGLTADRRTGLAVAHEDDLTWHDGGLRLFDPATGTPLPTYDDLLTAHLDAETRADQQAARAERAEAEPAALRRRPDPQH